MTLSDLERRDARGQILQADLLNNARTVWPIATKFDRITRGGVFQPNPRRRVPAARGRCPSAPQFWSFPSIYAFTLWCIVELPNLTW